MEKRKAIVLARVSTEDQTLDEQKKVLYEIAMRDGYSPNQIRYITHEVDDVELSEMDEGEDDLGLREMRNALMTGEYNAVYVWDISQIAYTKNMLFAIEAYLIKRRIYLVVKSCGIRLLNRDGTLNESADMAFTLWAQMAVMAMRHKKDGFRYGKKLEANGDKKAEAERRIVENTKLLAVIDARMDELEWKRKRLNWICDDIGDDEYLPRKSMLLEEKQNLEYDKELLEREIKKYQELIAFQ